MAEIILEETDNLFPTFDDLTPSTITLVSSLTSEIYSRTAFELLEVLEDVTITPENEMPRNKKLKFPLVKEQGILSLRLKDPVRVDEDDKSELPPGVVRLWDAKDSWLCRGMTGNKPFSTSLAVDYSGGVKNFSVKMFPVGKLQICGCRSYEESYQLIIRLVKALKKSGAVNSDIDIEWIDPQTINYRFALGFRVNFKVLSRILHDNGLVPGYDDLFSSKIEILIPSGISKDHLKSRKPPLQRISIYDSGKIVQGGPSLDELRESYDHLTDILSRYATEIKAAPKKSRRTMGEVEAVILELFEDEETTLTPREIGKAAGVMEKKRTNSILQKLVNEKKLTRIEETNGANPRYKLRGENGVAKRVEEPTDGKTRAKVDDDDVIACLTAYGAATRARDIAQELLSNDLRSSISIINSVLYRLERLNIVDKILVTDDDPHWELK
jgi:TATA-box binding protein (TBP) (component of TFIID and TFIIIB)